MEPHPPKELITQARLRKAMRVTTLSARTENHDHASPFASFDASATGICSPNCKNPSWISQIYHPNCLNPRRPFSSAKQIWCREPGRDAACGDHVVRTQNGRRKLKIVGGWDRMVQVDKSFFLLKLCPQAQRAEVSSALGLDQRIPV